MLRRIIVVTTLGTLAAASVAATRESSAVAKSPPWLSIEAPVNPFDQHVRGAVMLVHTFSRTGIPTVSDLSGAAEGIVDGGRKTVPLRFDATETPGVFAVRRQWSVGGTWMVRVSLAQVTALVMLDRSGNVVSTRIPTTQQNGYPIPRAVATREIDSALADAAKR